MLIRQIADGVARLHPLFALAAVLGVVVAAELLGVAAAAFFKPDTFPPESRIHVTVTTAVAMLFYLGYPVAIAIHVSRGHGRVTQVKPARMATAVLVMLAAYAIGIVNVTWLMPGGSGFGILMNMVVFAWLASAVYILWTAARGLVQAEIGRVTVSSRIFGTFLMFYAMPVFIYFLQRRVRRLDAQPRSPVPAI